MGSSERKFGRIGDTLTSVTTGLGRYFAETRGAFGKFFARGGQATRSPIRGQRPHNLSIESLEQRVLLAVNPAELAGLLDGLTYTGSDVPIEMHGSDAGMTPSLPPSTSLINMDAFRAAPQFAGVNGTGFTTVILDTGIDVDHAYFGPDTAPADGIADRIVYQWDFGNGDADASDVNGHGTHVAGISASEDGTNTGMAPGTNIIALKVFTDAGSGTFSMVESALQWVAANVATYNITSINMSLGDSGNYQTPQTLYGVDDEMAAIAAQDVLICSSAGNSFFGFGSVQGVAYPGADANSLAVSSVWNADNGGPFNWGSGATDNTTGADRLVSHSQRHATMTDIHAPGAYITSANEGGGSTGMGGTSMASPMMAGIATLAQQVANQSLARDLTLGEFRTLLASTSVLVNDGDDEDDNVTNTGVNFPRVDMLALGNGILAMAATGTVQPGEVYVWDLDGTGIGTDLGYIENTGDVAFTPTTDTNGVTDVDFNVFTAPGQVASFASTDAVRNIGDTMNVDAGFEIGVGVDSTAKTLVGPAAGSGTQAPQAASSAGLSNFILNNGGSADDLTFGLDIALTGGAGIWIDAGVTGSNITFAGLANDSSGDVSIVMDDGMTALAFGAIDFSGSGGLTLNADWDGDGVGAIGSIALSDITLAGGGMSASGGVSTVEVKDPEGASVDVYAESVGDVTVASTWNINGPGNLSFLVAGAIGTFGAADLDVNVTSTGSLIVAAGTSGTGGIGTLTFRDVTISGAGGVAVDAADNIGSAVFGVVQLTDDGNLHLDSDADGMGGGTIGAMTFGDTTIGDGPADDGKVEILGQGFGTTIFGNVVMNGSASADLQIDANNFGAPDGTLGPLSFASVTNDGAGLLEVDAFSMSTVAFGPVAINGAAGVDVEALDGMTNLTFGNIALSAAGGVLVQADGNGDNVGDIDDISFADVTISGTGSVVITGEDVDNVAVASTWSFAGTGSVTVTAVGGVFGNIGGAAWDIIFQNTAAAVSLVTFAAADGAGTVTIDQVDHVDTVGAIGDLGGISMLFDTDGDGVGPMGAFQIRTQGGDATNEVAWGINSVLVAEQIPSITVAGGARGAFVATGNGNVNANNDDDAIGPVIIGEDSTGVPVDNSDFTGVLFADDGIASMTVRGIDSQLGAFNSLVTSPSAASPALIDANTDSLLEDGTLGVGFAPGGRLGPVNVVGRGGSDSLVATMFASGFSTFVLQNGNWSADMATSLFVLPADKAAMADSNVDSIDVQFGNMNQNVFTNMLLIDDGFVNGITVSHPTANLGDAVIGWLSLDTDAVIGGAAIGGGLPGGVTASGSLTIAELETTDPVIHGGDGTDRAANDVGAIQAGEAIAIGTVDIGGDMLTVVVTEVGAAAPANGIVLGNGGGFVVNGNVDNIATVGDTAAPVGDNILIGAGTMSVIGGDLDTINAGAGSVTIVGGLNVVQGTTASPLIVITDMGVDYIVALEGTDAAGAVLDIVTFFPADAGVIGSRSQADGDEPTVLFADFDNLVNQGLGVDDTKLYVATRNQGTPYTAADDNPAEWDVVGMFDPDGDQSDFGLVQLEGDLLGDVGADGNLADGIQGIGGLFIANFGAFSHFHIMGRWVNGNGVGDGTNEANAIYCNDLGELSLGGGLGTGGTTDLISMDIGQNNDGFEQDLEIYGTFPILDALDVIVPIPDGGSVTKMFIGPAGTIEFITFTDADGGADGIVDTVVIDFAAGMIVDVHLFGENVGIEYNATDADNPATDGNTAIYYGVDQAGLAATEPSAAGVNGIAFLEFSSTIGNVSSTDIDPGNNIMAGVGNIVVGLVANINNTSDATAAVTYVNDPNNGTSGNTVALGAAGPVYGAVGDVTVDGPLGVVITTAGAGAIATTDTGILDDFVDGVPDANFAGLVTDGPTTGTIVVDGSVMSSLVVGDRIVTDLGPDATLGTGDDVIGIVGTPTFGGAITVAGNVGSAIGNAIVNGDVATDPTGNTPDTITGDEVSAPDGIAVDITVTEVLNAAIVSGKRILVDATEDQNDDDISGDIVASEIFGDIWSGDDLNGTLIVANGLGVVNAGTAVSGNISNTVTGNPVLNIVATGASSGDILADILAAGNMNNVFIDAGTGSGGSLLASAIAGTDGTGGWTGINNIHADDDLGAAPAGNDVISSADAMALNQVFAGLHNTLDPNEPTNLLDGGDINVDFVAGLPMGDTVPIGAPGSSYLSGVNSDGGASDVLPIFQAAVGDSITITTMQAGWVVDSTADADAVANNDMDSNLNGTLGASANVSVTTMQIDGNATGNDGVANGHLVVAGLGSPGNATIISGIITADLEGKISAGMFVPFDDAGPSPLNANDLGVLQAGTVLTQGNVLVNLTVGRWTSDTMELEDVLTGVVGLANESYVGESTVSATQNATVLITAVGRPWVADQTDVGSTTPNPADGDVLGVSLFAFNTLAGAVTAADAIDFTYVMSNTDAVTSIDDATGDPSDPSTTLPLNSGAAGHNLLNATAGGAGEGGLDVDYLTAALDPFVLISVGAGSLPTNAPATAGTTAPKVPSFWEAWGLGNIGAVGGEAPAAAMWSAQDADPTNGLEVADLSFALIGAGQDIFGEFTACDDIMARDGDQNNDPAILDGTPGLIPDGYGGWLDADIQAGLSANSSISQWGLSDLFPGGNIEAVIEAGDDIYSVASEIIETPGGTATFSETKTDSYSGMAVEDLITSLAVPQFDAVQEAIDYGGTLATLTNIQITRNVGTSNASVFVDNTGSGSAVNGDVVIERAIDLTVDGLVPDLAIFDNSGNQIGVVIPGGASQTFVPASDPLTAGEVAVVPSSFAAYEGLGSMSFQIVIDSDVLFNLSGGGGGSTTIVRNFPNYSADVSVTYTFDVDNAGTVEESDFVFDTENPFVVIAAQGHDYAGNGDVMLDMTSGAEEQLVGEDLFDGFGGFAGTEYEVDDDDADGQPDDETGNIWAFIIAGSDVTGIIDAGDVLNAGFPTGYDDAGDPFGSFFRGGIHAGAGVDLNINTGSDNDTTGDMDALVATEGDLNVEDWDTPIGDVTIAQLVNWDVALGDGQMDILLGIFAEDDMADEMAGGLIVGFGCVGGDLLGDVVAEGDITEINVNGHVGRANFDSVIYTGGIVETLIVGDVAGGLAPLLNGDGDINNDLTDGQDVGILYADVYMGNYTQNGAVAVGVVSVAPDANMAIGVEYGVSSFTLTRGAQITTYTFNTGRAAMFLQGGDMGDTDAVAPSVGTLDIVAYGPAGVNLTVAASALGDGAAVVQGGAASIHRLICGDALTNLHVNDGSVGQIVVDDDLPIGQILDTYLADVAIDPTAFGFLSNSLPVIREVEEHFNDNKLPIDTGRINVDYNIGITEDDNDPTLAPSIGFCNGLLGTAPLTVVGGQIVTDNYAIYSEGSLRAEISSESGSIGNMVVWGKVADIHAGNVIMGTNPDVVVVIDVSGSTSSAAAGSSVGDINGDSSSDTILDTELAGFIALNNYLIGAYGSKAEVAIVVFGDSAVQVEMDATAPLVAYSTALSIPCNTDADANGTPDVEDLLRQITGSALGAGGGTNYAPALTMAATTLAGIAGTPANGNVVFLSDGGPGDTYTAEVAAVQLLADNVRAFGAGSGAPLPPLQIIDPNAQVFTNGNELVAFFGGGAGGMGGGAGGAAGTAGMFTAWENIGDLFVGVGSVTADNVFTAYTGGLGVVSAEDNIIDPSIDVSTDVGGLIARTGRLSATLDVHGSVGLLQASHDIDVEIDAETGSIGIDLCVADMFTAVHGAEIHSDIGDISATLVAGDDIGNTYAYVGSLTAIDYLAADSVGNLSAGLNIVSPVVTAERGSIGDLLAVAGDITSPTLVAGTTIGDSDANLGSLLDLNYIAGLAVGDFTAAEDITGTVKSVGGAVGNFKTMLGDIGTAVAPLIVEANGGVEIDPWTLEYMHIVNGTVLDGVGTVYAEIGNIHADIRTGGSLGVTQGNQVIGGIAAPLGVVDVELRIGGHLGGLSGADVWLSTESIILGSIGVIRNVQDGGGSVGQIDPSNPLIVISEDVDYRVEITVGTAAVDYTISNGVLVFNSITYDAVGSAAGIVVRTTEGGRRQLSGDIEDVDVAVTVEEMDIIGNVADVTVEGVLEELTVHGNLVGGTLSADSAGTIHVMGNLGSAVSGSNPFVAADMDISVARFDSLTVDGTNYGLVSVELCGLEALSFANTLDNRKGAGDDFINVFLSAGNADVTVNNGFLQEIALGDGFAGSLVVTTSSSPIESASNANPTQLAGLDLVEQLVQPVLVDLGLRSLGSFDNFVYENGVTSTGDDDTAHVGTIIAEGGAGALMTSVIVEGDARQIIGSVANSSLLSLDVAGNLGDAIVTSMMMNVDVRGNAGVIDGGLTLMDVEVDGNLLAAKAINTIIGVNTNGNLGTATTGGLLMNVMVDGNAGALTAGRTMINVDVMGDADLVSSGGLMSNVAIRGDVDSLAASFMTSVGVSGGVHTLEADYLLGVAIGGNLGHVTVRQYALGADDLVQRATDAYVRVPGYNRVWLKVDGVLIATPELGVINSGLLVDIF